jgi:hypothetical protein
LQIAQFGESGIADRCIGVVNTRNGEGIGLFVRTVTVCLVVVDVSVETVLSIEGWVEIPGLCVSLRVCEM